jgi:predicted branched-subunit amino acid permease
MDGTGAPGAPQLAERAVEPGEVEGRWRAFRRGAGETPVTPPLVLAFSFVGFGALTKAAGLSLLHTLFISIFIFALPGQVVLVDEMARGASMLTAALAVTATAVRLLPMTMALLPVLREPGGPKWLEILVTNFIAITVWVESLRRAPHQARKVRAAYTMGIAAVILTAASGGATVGFLLAANVPAIFAAALLFLMPIYFLLSMISSSRNASDIISIVMGLVLGPLMHLAVPQVDLLLTGLIGGTASFFMARLWRARRQA